MVQPAAAGLVRQRRFGHYEIIEMLGVGGMGEVYRARDLTLRRAVAIKVLRGSAAKDPERLARFEQEARSASALNHPNIVTIYEVGSAEGVRYIAMELVEGSTLRQILSEGPLVTRRALQLAAQAAGGLAQAHDAGIVHRDLKPENIMVTRDGRVKILDFGLAKLVAPSVDDEATTASGDSPETGPGRILGTVGYMSPEQAEGRPLDFRSDQFSCGAILYEMATGRPAFRRPSRPQTLAAIVEEDPPSIATLNPSVPPPLRWIIERCLAKEPGDRYAATRDMARDLENVLVHLAEMSPAPRREGEERRRAAAPWIRRRGVVIAGVLAMACLIGVAAWIARSRLPDNVAGGAVPTAGPGIPTRRSVAVLGFKNLSGRPGAAWLSTALAEMLTTELAAGGRLRTIPGENIGRMKMELSLSDAESLARDTLAKVGRNLGTDMVLLGSYLILPEDQIRLDMRLQDVGAGETVAAIAESGTETKLVDLVMRAGSRLRQSMGVDEPPASEVSALAAGAPSNLEAQRLYAEGLAKLRILDALSARDLLQKAVAADPNSPMAHGALADAWTMLGYDPKAKEEAQRAFDLSGHLGREERLSVEGRYRETAGEWDKAIEIYGGLLAFFPDNVEYGLRLATAQSTAGRGQDALATLGKLRTLPRRGAEDPRIDLTEAAVAQALGDFKLQQAAANQAAVKGGAQGSRLLVARARHREAFALDRLGEVERAAVAAEEARKIYSDAGDRIGLARAWNAIGVLAWDHGELEKAKTAWEEALAIRQQIGYRRGVAASLDNLGLVHWEQGDLTAARRNLEQGYAIYRELGDRPGLASDLENIAGLLGELGDLAGARRMGEQGLTLARQIGDKNEEALVLMRLAVVMQAEGNLEGAEATHREALSILRDRGTRDAVAETLFHLGELLQVKGDLTAARKNHEEALKIRTTLRAAYAAAKSQVALANLSIEEGHPDAVPPLVRSASAVFVHQKAADWVASAHAVLACSLLVRGEPGEAQRAIEEAAVLAGRSQSPRVRLAVATTTARIRAANGRGDDALHALEAALTEATRLRLVGLQLEIRLAQGEISLASGRKVAERDLAALAKDARARGFGLVGSKAEALLRDRPARGGAAS
jgi:tetratricopeptide (TPR) repeat protein/TolB-like protein